MHKAFLKIVGIIFLLFIVSSLGGYIYFINEFKAPKNRLIIEGSNSSIPITWTSNEVSNRAGMFIPVMLSNVPDTFYIQFDPGAVYSLLYKSPIESINLKYSNALNINKNKNSIEDVVLKIDKLYVRADSLILYPYGKEIDWKSGELKIIGTLGADLLEKTLTGIDFKNSLVHFIPSPPDSLVNSPKTVPFEFDERRIMINVKMDGDDYKFMWDSGSSSYDLITSKSTWEALLTDFEKVKPHESNQMSRKLKVYTGACNKSFSLGQHQLSISNVSYVQGFPWYTEMMFDLSGMQGMIGNGGFRESTILINAKDETLILY